VASNQLDMKGWLVMSHDFTEVSALEILDSRGRPTVQVSVRLADGSSGTAWCSLGGLDRDAGSGGAA
jgi:enolase